MKFRSTVLAAGLALLATQAHAAVTFQYLFDGGYPNAVSYDGGVVAGNTSGDYSAFRWTAETGFVRLERSALAIVGNTGGAPGVSADGTRIASTISSEDSTFTTSGRWTLGAGWQQIAPPVPPTGGIMDGSLCDVWGLSGNGEAVVGLYWRPGQTDGSAHAYRWTQATGMVDLDQNSGSSRPNGVNYDGSVVAGWDAHPQYGYWRPAAWRGTALTVLGDDDAIGEGKGVSPNGEWIVGYQRNPATNTREAARWHWDGGAWGPTQFLGSVPGTFPDQGLAYANAVSADGRLVIGYDSFYGDPYYTTGFIWTDSTGCMDIEFWLADKGVDLDPLFDIRSLQSMTPDGRTLLGWGWTTVVPYTLKTFAIQLDRDVAAVGPAVAGPALRLLASPNPARDGTSLAFALPSAGRASLAIHDAAGRLVRRVLEGELAAGEHRVAWDGRDGSRQHAAPGIYFARLEAGAVRATTRLVVLE